jgi:hypothetical protein
MREIRENERVLISFLLYEAGLDPSKFKLSQQVDEYEGGKMGSIGLGSEQSIYNGDIIQAEYIDADDVVVVITLTKDTEGGVLDLDFWKTDSSALIRYPEPGQLILKKL